jgi:hypothetical protein
MVYIYIYTYKNICKGRDKEQRKERKRNRTQGPLTLYVCVLQNIPKIFWVFFSKQGD